MLIATILIEFERPLTEQQEAEVREAIHTAVRNRLFGSGFLPSDVEVSNWSSTVATEGS